jgi:hypothetical protein
MEDISARKLWLAYRAGYVDGVGRRESLAWTYYRQDQFHEHDEYWNGYKDGIERIAYVEKMLAARLNCFDLSPDDSVSIPFVRLDGFCKYEKRKPPLLPIESMYILPKIPTNFEDNDGALPPENETIQKVNFRLVRCANGDCHYLEF